jgi:hypothetical protein
VQAAAVEKDGGLGNFAKNTTTNVLTGVFDKVPKPQTLNQTLN